mmetsp:Transcript_4045/g.8121  ORF Transcript_4045/g.8121 Transcript_4045/m.8121 type:complete len:667 (-) Transcript_4045:109-2109(-)
MNSELAYGSPSVESGPNVGGTTTPFRLIGIAFVVDQKGRGSRTVMRYPIAPSQPEDADDVFFRLGQRQLSKLFRPKPSLCAHPMTLAIGSTIFCCRAILLEDYHVTSTTDDASSSDDRVELFSVVVALAPQERGPIVPITGWFEEQNNRTDKKDEEDGGSDHDEDGQGRASPSFKTVRRVHLSLARLCRVLEREEKRCSYVSIQSAQYLRFRKKMKAEVTVPVPSPTSVSSNKVNHIRRTSTFSSIFEREPGGQQSTLQQQSQQASQQQTQGRSNSSAKSKQNEELEQDVLEMFMATETSPVGKSPMHSGNLALELVQFHHAMARNDYSFPPSPSLLLTGRDGIVHINGHIAVAVEAVSPRIIQEQEVRPYETLLFPYASPKELLESLAGYGSSASRRLQQVLLTVNPQKSLLDIATDANLSLQSSMEIAKYLVGKSAAIVSPVISRNCRFACDRVQQLQNITLPFAHEFGAQIDLFSLVSFLTQSGWKLEEAITNLLVSTDEAVVRLRSQLSTVTSMVPSTELPEGVSDVPAAAIDPMPMGVIRDHSIASMEELEDTMFQLTVWLCSHRVLVHLNEYLVAAPSSSWKSDEATEQKMSEKDLSSDDALFHELQELDCLTGTISIPACSWRIGMDQSRLRAFAERHSQIRVVQRPFEVGDDWGRLFD